MSTCLQCGKNLEMLAAMLAVPWLHFFRVENLQFDSFRRKLWRATTHTIFYAKERFLSSPVWRNWVENWPRKEKHCRIMCVELIGGVKRENESYKILLQRHKRRIKLCLHRKNCIVRGCKEFHSHNIVTCGTTTALTKRSEIRFFSVEKYLVWKKNKQETLIFFCDGSAFIFFYRKHSLRVMSRLLNLT